MEKYLPLGVVGEGSYGVVLKCRCRDNGKLVAIKKFIDSEDDQNVRKIAMREIRVLRKLRHENLVNLIEVFRRRKHIYLVFEFIDHTLLDQLEQKSHGLDEDTCRKYIFQILRGLGFCHDNNIIHRDIKPENILVSKTGIVKLCDFGFARNLCGPGDVYTDYVATRWYRAPELLVGDVAYGKEVDIWAVGCLFAEMMTGEPLFPGDSDIDQLFLIAQCLGRLSKRHLNIMARNSAFRGFQYPKSRHGSTTSTGSSKGKFGDNQKQTRHDAKVSVFSVMFPSWSDDAVLFLTLCLDPEPSARPHCNSLLRLPYFIHDNFPSRFLTELNQKLQQEGRGSIKTFSKKQPQRIANVSPSVPLAQKHIQSSHPILRTSSMDDPSAYKFLPANSNGSSNILQVTNSTSISRQHTFIVDKTHSIKSSKNYIAEQHSRIPRKLSEEGAYPNGTSSSLNGPNSLSLPSAKTNTSGTFALPDPQIFNHSPNGFSAQQSGNSSLPPSISQENRRFSMSKKYTGQADDNPMKLHFDMHSNSQNINSNQNSRQLPVTTLTFLGTNSYNQSSSQQLPMRSPNTAVNIGSNSLPGQKKLSPKKANFYSQNSVIRPLGFTASTTGNKESFLPRMKIADESSSSLPFLALGSPTKTGTSSIRKKEKWEPSMNKRSYAEIGERSNNERAEAPSPKNTLPLM